MTEMQEINRSVSAATTTAIHAASQLAQALIQARIALVRRLAQERQQSAMEERARLRAWHQADSAVWSRTGDADWWRRAGVDDISQAWRAASSWHHIDPRAQKAREDIAEGLSRRGVKVDPEAGLVPENVEWLSDALDQAAVEHDATTATPGQGRGRGQVIDGDLVDTTRRGPGHEIAEHLRAVWPEERVSRVMAAPAWAGLAQKLGELDRRGHDVRALLASVDAFVDHARDPAAFTYRKVAEAVAAEPASSLNTADRQRTRQARERAEGEGARASQRDARAAQLDGQDEHAGSDGVRLDQVAQGRSAEVTYDERATHHEAQAEVAGAQATAAQARAAEAGVQHQGAAAAAKAYPQSTKASLARAAETPVAKKAAVQAKASAQGRPVARPPRVQAER